MTVEVCGYCSGTGYTFGRCFDREGRAIHADPPQVSCEYCCGNGQCEEGGKLLPATPAHKIERPTAADLARTGNPAWG
jgi:hypothetical protein